MNDIEQKLEEVAAGTQEGYAITFRKDFPHGLGDLASLADANDSKYGLSHTFVDLDNGTSALIWHKPGVVIKVDGVTVKFSQES